MNLIYVISLFKFQESVELLFDRLFVELTFVFIWSLEMGENRLIG